MAQPVASQVVRHHAAASESHVVSWTSMAGITDCHALAAWLMDNDKVTASVAP